MTMMQITIVVEPAPCTPPTFHWGAARCPRQRQSKCRSDRARVPTPSRSTFCCRLYRPQVFRASGKQETGGSVRCTAPMMVGQASLQQRPNDLPRLQLLGNWERRQGNTTQRRIQNWTFLPAPSPLSAHSTPWVGGGDLSAINGASTFPPPSHWDSFCGPAAILCAPPPTGRGQRSAKCVIATNASGWAEQPMNKPAAGENDRPAGTCSPPCVAPWWDHHCNCQDLHHLRCHDHHHNRLAPCPPPSATVDCCISPRQHSLLLDPSTLDDGDPSSSSSLCSLNPIAHCLLHCPPPTLSSARLRYHLPLSNHQCSCCLQKLQHNVRRCKAMTYFMQDDVKRLTWLVPLFNHAKGKEGG
jgi:hypothetical protein